jgi:hypothetical protein
MIDPRAFMVVQSVLGEKIGEALGRVAQLEAELATRDKRIRELEVAAEVAEDKPSPKPRRKT